ncbi:amidohydrolase family protein [Streptomyces europaeiscabiei]|uniref:hypothetical protein n=1 Tax=Streptomyces europaeiscabiei TaxID=146819 RepID=UPI000AD7E629|nr:hypothetical protein [Streptomyces europaeiscabiei]
MGGWPSWSVQAHLDLMDHHGIDTAMLSMSSPGVHFGDDKAARLLARRVNEYTAEPTRDHPGRFGNFVSLPLPTWTAHWRRSPTPSPNSTPTAWR